MLNFKYFRFSQNFAFFRRTFVVGKYCNEGGFLLSNAFDAPEKKKKNRVEYIWYLVCERFARQIMVMTNFVQRMPYLDMFSDT